MDVQVISSTVQRFNGVSYYLCGKYFQRRGVRLHRMVWEYHNGKIPQGYHVHHVTRTGQTTRSRICGSCREMNMLVCTRTSKSGSI